MCVLGGAGFSPCSVRLVLGRSWGSKCWDVHRLFFEGLDGDGSGVFFWRGGVDMFRGVGVLLIRDLGVVSLCDSRLLVR